MTITISKIINPTGHDVIIQCRDYKGGQECHVQHQINKINRIYFANTKSYQILDKFPWPCRT